MIAKVIGITEKPTAKGGIYYNLQLDVAGKKVTLNSFQSVDNATFKQASESGASVDITTSKNDKGYDNIDSVSLVPGTAPAEKPIPQSTAMPDRQFKANPEKQASIELQHYTADVKDLWIAGKLTDKSPLVEKYLFILARKIGVDLNTVTPEPPQATPAAQKPVTPVIVPPANPVIPRVNALTLEALNQLAKDKDTFDRIKLEVKTKGWTTGKDKFTLKDLTQPQADIIIKQFSTQITEDNIPFN